MPGIMPTQAELVLDCRCQLAEGPVWWEGQLWFVDIEGKTLNRFDPTTKQHAVYDAGQRLGFAVPTDRAGEWIVGLQEGLARWTPAKGGLPEIFARPEAGKDRVIRFNDGKTDPNGKLFAGTMPLDGAKHLGSLYRVDGDMGVTTAIDKISLSNGLAWDVARRTMYYIDTPTKQIDAIDYDAATSEISNRRTIHKIEDGIGGPDGMCIDSAGNLWVALWGGRRVRCVDPTHSQVVTEIPVPANAASSCCFGGDDLKTLYITTAKLGEGSDSSTHPHAGSIFAVRLDVPGLATVPFKFA